MLDYRLEDLAEKVARSCFEFNQIEDMDRGEVFFNQVMNFMNKQSSLGI